ncbi:MAG: S8 family serine peptidase [Myxococcota bacterium]
MNSSRALPLTLLFGAAAALWLVPHGSPAPVSGDGVAPSATAAPGTIVVDFADDLDPDEVAEAGRAAGVLFASASEVSEDEALYVADAADAAAALATLRSRGDVEVAEPVVEMQALGYPNDPAWDKQWNFPMVGAPVGWRVGGGEGVVVAVIDTGVSALPDLPADRILEGRSFVPGAPTAKDDHGHGTHVAGTIAQETNNGVGAAGLAPNVRILPLKVLTSSGFGTSAWIAAAIDEAVDQGADVINLSLGGGHSDVVVNAVEKARKAGVVVVAAAGNSGRQGIGSPADAPSAIAVTAVGPDDALAPYSSWGKGVEIAAPGGNKQIKDGGIVQATIDGKGGQQLAEWQGTSMASPHVAGAAAVLIGAGAQSADEVERFLKTSADGREDPLKFGAGRLDLGAAVRKLLFVKQGVLFAIGATMAFSLAWLGALTGRARAAALWTGAIVAGGLFVLPLLPLSTWLRILSKPLLAWPGPFWSGFPLWQSCAIPLVASLVLGPSLLVGPVAMGLCAGIGGYLLYGAATGGTDLWWMPFGFDRTWLALNGTVCLLAGMAVAGMQKMRRRGEA